MPAVKAKNINVLSVRGMYGLAKAVTARGDFSDVLRLLNGPGETKPCITVRAGRRRLHVIQDEALARQMIAAIDEGQFRKPDFIGDTVSLFGGTGFLGSNGELWQQQRRIFEPASHPTPAFLAIIKSEAEALVQKWFGRGGTENLVQDIRSYALKAHCRGPLDYDYAAQSGSDDPYAAFGTAAEYFSRNAAFFVVFQYLGFNASWMMGRMPKLAAARDVIKKTVIELVEAKSASSPDTDPVANILRRNNYFSSPTRAERAQACDEIVSLLVTGIMPASPLAHAVSQIAASEDLRDELRAELTDDGRGLTPKFKNRILQWFAEKPGTTISVPRVAQSDIRLGDMLVMKGEYVIINLEAMPVSPGHKAGYAFFGGRHVCPARSFSMHIGVALLTRFVRDQGSMDLLAPVRDSWGLNRVSRGGAIQLDRPA
jgi:cytochrome P450